jgi:hypothetical protein
MPLAASPAVTDVKASVKAVSNASRVCAFAALNYVLIFDRHFLIGFKSGE